MYETASDIAQERMFQGYMLSLGKELHKLPISYGVDFACCNKGSKVITSFIEFKSRKMKWGQYPDIMLSALKATTMYNLRVAHNIEVFFVVEANGEYHYTNDFLLHKMTYTGRTTNTRDSADIEPVINIPIESFKKFK
jgi:hypothetical protein